MSNPEYDKLMNDIKDKSESTKKIIGYNIINFIN